MTTRRVFRTAGAAEYLGISGSWLEKLRLAGAGPRWIRLGQRAIVYDIRDLDRWLDRHREPLPRTPSSRKDRGNLPSPDVA